MPKKNAGTKKARNMSIRLPVALKSCCSKNGSISLSNVKEHAPLSARASVDHGVEGETTGDHVNRAADRGCCVSPCCASLFCGEMPPIPLRSQGFDSYANCTQPIDFGSIRRNVATGAVRESRNGNIVIVSRDPDNPDCVVEIVGAVKLGAENEQTKSVRDARGYLGYIINGELVRNKEVAADQMLETFCVDSSKNGVMRGSVEANVPVVGEYVAATNDNPTLNKVAGETIQGASIGSELRGSHRKSHGRIKGFEQLGQLQVEPLAPSGL
jgi:hypothetical protein